VQQDLLDEPFIVAARRAVRIGLPNDGHVGASRVVQHHRCLVPFVHAGLD
jgi:hypothetical protein